MNTNRNSQPENRFPIPDAIKAIYGYKVDSTDTNTDTEDSSEDIPNSSSLLTALIVVYAIILVLCPIISRICSDLYAINLINANHGMTLEEFCEGTRHEPYEYWSAFDENGRKVGEYTTHDVGCVSIPNELHRYAEQRNATADAHCHPGYDCPFSIPDLKYFLLNYYNYSISKTYVVSPNYLYCLEITSDIDVVEIYGEYLDFISTFFEAYHDDPTYFTYQTLADGSTGYASTDAFIQIVANQFGFIFTKTPLD